ncbi:MAG TPA: hypothetical protein VK086_01430 [Ruania sp.]|nr:hypothetical protein [Ruania sp.]
MSTQPGRQSWRDAGLDPDAYADPDDLIDQSADEAPASGEDYEPQWGRADLSGQADEADVAEQSMDVPEEEEEFEDQ